ncbi:MAG: hypothetical protein FWH12_02550 [Treponema sp.]|nr:hypothetical protein [Treponema sp.]
MKRYLRKLALSLMVLGVLVSFSACLDPISLGELGNVNLRLEGNFVMTDATSGVLVINNLSRTVDVTEVYITYNAVDWAVAFSQDRVNSPTASWWRFTDRPRALTRKAQYLPPTDITYEISVKYRLRTGLEGELPMVSAVIPLPGSVYNLYIYRDRDGNVIISPEKPDGPEDPNDTGDPGDDPLEGEGSSPPVITPGNQHRLSTFVVNNMTRSMHIDSVRFRNMNDGRTYEMGPVSIRDELAIALGFGNWQTTVRYRDNNLVQIGPRTVTVVPSNDPQAINHYLWFYKTNRGSYDITTWWPPGDEDHQDFLPPEDEDDPQGRGALYIVNNTNYPVTSVLIENYRSGADYAPLFLDSERAVGNPFVPARPINGRQTGYVNVVGTSAFPIEAHVNYKITVLFSSGDERELTYEVPSVWIKDTIVPIIIDSVTGTIPGGECGGGTNCTCTIGGGTCNCTGGGACPPPACGGGPDCTCTTGGATCGCSGGSTCPVPPCGGGDSCTCGTGCACSGGGSCPVIPPGCGSTCTCGATCACGDGGNCPTPPNCGGGAGCTCLGNCACVNGEPCPPAPPACGGGAGCTCVGGCFCTGGNPCPPPIIIPPSDPGAFSATRNTLIDTGLALRDGQVWVWGFRGSGQHGTGNGHFTTNSVSNTAPPAPANIPGNPTITQVTGSNYTIVALEGSSGRLWGWGLNGYGSAGVGASGIVNNPRRINFPDYVVGTSRIPVEIKQIAAGENFFIALDQRGGVWTWGHNLYGQLGTGGHGNHPVPVRVNLGTIGSGAAATPRTARLIGAAYEGAFAVTDDDQVWVWGDNEASGLGFAGSSYGVQRIQRAPTRAANLETHASQIDYIAGGNGWGQALLKDGSVIGWGLRASLGQGTTSTASSSATVITNILTNVDVMHSRYVGTIALTKDGRVYTWGQTGGSAFPTIYGASVTLRSVSATGGVTDIGGGKEHVYYIANDRVWGAGYGAAAKLNLSSGINRAWPGVVVNLPWN